MDSTLPMRHCAGPANEGPPLGDASLPKRGTGAAVIARRRTSYGPFGPRRRCWRLHTRSRELLKCGERRPERDQLYAMSMSSQMQALSDTGYQYTFTVFTPTYNHAYTLHRVYESLCVQTYRNFEWLVVDDGSSDDTRKLIDTWEQQARFPLRYIYQPNQGKHVAFNRGVREARGELFLCLDSDDGCVPKALERLKYHWDQIPFSQRHRFSAVTALCIDELGGLHGSRFPQDITDSDSLEI